MMNEPSASARVGSPRAVARDVTGHRIAEGLKRGLDLAVTAPLLLALSPLLLAVGLLVRGTSPGPALFRQERVGRHGARFRLYKFRTMYVDSDTAPHRAYVAAVVQGTAARQDGAFKLAADPRVTPLGRLLRRFSLDELPQLWNVLRGEMSLVGPRPPIPYELEHYCPGDLRRLEAKPGLTGLWQVRGRTELDFRTMVALDLEYIDHWSIWMELAILCRTPWAVLTGRGAR
jgi:lipopolysaccharide/colanic/teichoic acid biosynthesis glycosyltransferase